MNKYLKLAIGIAIASIIISGGILLTTWPDIAHVFSEADHLRKIELISGISTAISAIFGLLIGSIAIIAVIVAQKSENISIESLKLDLIALVSALLSIRNRCYLYTNPALINYNLDLFEKERTHLQSFIGSSSGYALYIWNLQTKRIEKLDINIELSSLIDFLTLHLSENTTVPILNTIALRCQKLLNLLTEIDDRDFKQISANLHKIGNGLNHVKSPISTNDTFSTLGNDMINDEDEQIEALELPADEFVQKVIDNANKKIGGKAEETVMHFLNEAKAGNKKSLALFYKMVNQLKLDE